MAEQKTTENVNFCKIETTVSMNENTYEIIETEIITEIKRDCIVYNIPTHIGIEYTGGKEKLKLTDRFELKAYKYTEKIEDKDIVKIGVYATTKEPIPIHIYEDLWYIKLSVNSENDPPYIYVNFIRNMNKYLLDSTVKNINHIYNTANQQTTKVTSNFYTFFDTDNIFKIIKEIAKQLRISKIILQDDAEFPCNNDLQYGIKAVQLRALMPNTDVELGTWHLKQDPEKKSKDDKSKLSIYQRSGFTPVKYKKTPITGCIKALQEVTCKTLNNTANQLKKLLTRINDKDITYAIYKIKIKEEDELKIEYTEVKENNYSSICRDYIRNLDLLINIFSKAHINMTIYEYYKSICKEEKQEPTCCKIRGDILGYLRNSINSHVIIIKGINTKEKDDKNCYGEITPGMKDKLKITKTSTSTVPVLPTGSASDNETAKVQPIQYMTRASSAPPRITVANDPIIVTKLFNLFYGTFEKLKYIFFKMELDLHDDDVAATAP